MATDFTGGKMAKLVDGDQAASKKASGKPTMHLKVQAPFKIYFDDDVYSVSSKNATGPFDVLPHHDKFITILSQGELNIDAPRGGQQKIIISGGLMHVKADRVAVFLDV